jgi:formylglycine-generating enzyme required for sulfatase activity
MKPRLIKTAIALLLTACAVQASNVWNPAAPSGTTPVPENVCVVEQGIEHQRDGDGHVHGIGAFHRYRIARDSSGLFQMFTAGKDYTEYHDFDVNGDGDPSNDTVGCHPFSMDKPLSMDAPFYDTTIGDQKFYGGCTIYHANTRKSGFTEDGMNDYEEGMGFQPRRNWTFFNENYDIFSPFRMYMVALWKKSDFMNGGDKYPVSFNEDSKLAYLVMRYYMGIEGFRFVVQNGDRFYISEKTFHGSGPTLGNNGGIAHTIYPAKEQWAEYNPQAPYKIDFDPSKAVFKPVTFDNVTAFGWYLYKDKLISGYVGHKWYGFEANAVVHRPARPSENIAMAKVDNFYISKTEVPYELWRKVHRLKRSNTFVLQKNCTFDKYGDLGSMDYSASLGRLQDAFSQDEPVTDITLYDMLAWCNALSEQESKTPCYYIDPEFKEKFREVRRSMLYIEPYTLPKIYVNWAANGYRLPAAGEWSAASGGQKPEDRGQKTEKTSAVGGGSPNAQGLYDMLGNVWETVWTFGDVLDPSSDPEITVVGGDFLQSKNPAAVSASPWGDSPYNGSWNIGFRIVRREAGLSAPSGASPSVPVWKLTKNTKTAADTARQTALPAIKLTPIPGEPFSLGTYEVSFAEWKQIFNWATANGFEFDHGGEMGSMAYWGWGEDWDPGLHTPDEPVTGITHYDTLVWLNALSTLEGKTPVYYHDKDFTQPYKKSYRYRPLMTWLGEKSATRYGWNENDPTFSKKDANGYRLPTVKEFDRTAYGGDAKPAWKGSREKVAENAWLADTSGFKTHERGKLSPNKFGLYDMAGNVSEWSDDIDVGKNRGCIAERMGGGFFDLAVVQGDRPKPPDTTRGLMYPDVGLRVVIKNNAEGK